MLRQDLGRVGFRVGSCRFPNLKGLENSSEFVLVIASRSVYGGSVAGHTHGRFNNTFTEYRIEPRAPTPNRTATPPHHCHRQHRTAPHRKAYPRSKPETMPTAPNRTVTPTILLENTSYSCPPLFRFLPSCGDPHQSAIGRDSPTVLKDTMHSWQSIP